MVPVPSQIKNLNFRGTNSTNELVFLASELPPLGYKSFFITKLEDGTEFLEKPEDLTEQAEPVQVGNKFFNLTFGENGLVDTITIDGVTSKLTQ